MIEIENIHKSFNNHEVLRGISLRVEQGKNTVVMGKSGAGKSVLLKLILRLLWPDEGRIIVDGVDVFELSKRELNRLRLKFGMLFQSAALFDSLTVYDNVGIGLRFLKRMQEDEMREKILQCLEMVELEDVSDKYPSELSGGMRKRVGLARAMAMDPQYILYDEPTTGLDPITSDAIANLIRKLQRELKITSVIVTHDLRTASIVGDKIALLNDGVFCFTGTVEEMLESDNPMVQQFVHSKEGVINGR